jgi:hypothetical protein
MSEEVTLSITMTLRAWESIVCHLGSIVNPRVRYWVDDEKAMAQEAVGQSQEHAIEVLVALQNNASPAATDMIEQIGEVLRGM